jgi:hypothetical protein
VDEETELGKACYHSVQDISSSRLLSKNIKIKIYKTIILPVIVYETWSLALRGEHRLRVFEDSVFSRIFGPKRDEVTGGWRKPHNEELRNLYSSPIIRMNKSRMDNIRMDLREVGRGCMDWIDLAQDRDQWRALVNKIMNLWVS